MGLKPGYKQTEVGVIPEDWEVRPLLSVVVPRTGQVDPRSEPYTSMVLVAPNHIESRTGRLLEQSTSSAQHAISGKYLFEPGDIIYSKIRPYLRKAILASFPGLCSADMYPLTPAQDVASAFIFAVLLGHRFSSFAENVSVRSGIPKINRVELAEFVVALPCLPEQRAIAAALSDVDALLVSLDALIAKKRDLKQAALQQLLTGKQRLPGFGGEKPAYKETEVGVIPVDWETYRIGTVAKVKTGPFGSALHERDYVQDGTPIVTVEHLSDFGISHTDLPMVSEADRRRLEAYTLDLHDIVFSRVGSIDRSALVRPDETGWLFSGRLLRVRPSAKVLDSCYLSYHFQGEPFRLRVRSLAVGQTMPSLNTKILSSIEVIVPGLPEQHAIAAVLSAMDAELAALEARREKTRGLKQGMMQELLTGRVRLPVRAAIEAVATP